MKNKTSQTTLNCISIDDNPAALAALRQLIEQVDFLHLKGEFTNAVEALGIIQNKDIDLLFLDVEMPGITGLELVDSLENPPLIIMVTGKKEYALDAFEKHVVDYLLKPVRLPRFLSSVNFARKIYESRMAKKESSNTIFVKANGRWNKLNVADIRYLQAMGDYVRIFTKNEKYMVNKTMKTLMANLPPDKFARVHRSYIVNIDHIENIEENTIVTGRDVIPISERYKSAFMQQLNLL
ncbi:MAG TPA: response regulator transcription factor [Bacteroidetes bacterium]|nr:response regulator transcription factor [Bacteroidota bacterium]